VTDAVESNGCLWVVPGSHMEHVHSVDRDQREHAQLGYIEIFDYFAGEEGQRHAQQAVPVRMRKGDVLFFDANIIHGSTDNTTAAPRATMLYHFAPSSGTPPATRKLPYIYQMCQVQTEAAFAERHPSYAQADGKAKL